MSRTVYPWRRIQHPVKHLRWNFLRAVNSFHKKLSLRKKSPYLQFFWSDCGKMRTRKTPNTDTFHAVFILDIA